jgi:DNA-binding response OmpR family regulator
MNNKVLNILKRSSVLLVNDNKSVREKLINFLLLYFGKIYEAKNGNEALEVYNIFNPSIIISDIEMSEIDGLIFLKRIRKLNKDLPIIVITSSTKKKYLLETITISLIDYLIKPISHQQLIKVLSKTADLIKTVKLFSEIKIKENCVYDTINKRLIINREYHHLSKAEIFLLELFLSNRGFLVTKEMIISIISIFEEKSSSFFYHNIYKLRKKIGKELIVNVSNKGYIFV